MSCVVRLDTIRDSRNGYIHTRGARERLRARQRFFLSPGPARPAAGAGEAERCPRTSPAGRSRFFTSLVGPPAFLSLFAHISFTALAHAHTSVCASAARRSVGAASAARHQPPPRGADLCAAARVLVHTPAHYTTTPTRSLAPASLLPSCSTCSAAVSACTLVGIWPSVLSCRSS